MEFFDLTKALLNLDRAKQKQKESYAKLKNWENAHPNWESDWDNFDKLLPENDALYDDVNAFDNLVDALDNYIYEYRKLVEMQDELELALTEVGWNSEK